MENPFRKKNYVDNRPNSRIWVNVILAIAISASASDCSGPSVNDRPIPPTETPLCYPDTFNGKKGTYLHWPANDLQHPKKIRTQMNQGKIPIHC